MAGDHGLHRDAVACIHTPTARGTVADGGNTPQRFMAGNSRHGGAEHAFELFVVTATDTARLDLQNCAVVIDIGNIDVHGFEYPIGGLHHGKGLLGQHGRLPVCLP